MERLGPVDVEFLINNPEFTQASNKVKDELKGITRTATEEAQRAEAVYKKLGAAIAGYFSVQAISGFAREIATVRGEFQKLEISLETILGSKERADQILAQAVELAAKTPFDLSGVGEATKQLLAYGFEAENVIEEIRRLGDVSAGLNIPLSDMAYLYGTTRVQGRLFAQDLMQFTNRGIPMIQELAKQFGVAEDEVKALVSAGKVGFPEVEKAIHSLTNEGGMFFNLMEKQSASIPGQLANLGDAWEMAMNDMGKSSEGFISDGIAGVTVLVENYQTVIDIVKVAAISYGSYRAALMLTSVATKAMTAANAGMTASQILLNRWTVIATRAQRILNATMLSNPYVAAATALAALVSAVVIFNKSTKDAITVSEDFKTAIKEEINAANELFKTLKNTNTGTEDRAEAIKKINEVYGKYLPQQLTEKSNLEDIEAAQKAVNEAIAESIFLRSQESDLASLREGTEKYAERFGKAVQDVIKDAKLSNTVAGQLSAELETAMEEFSKNANTPIAQIQARFDKILRDFGVDFSLLGSGANNISTFNYQDLLSDTQAYARALNQEKATTEGLAEAKKGYLQQLGLLKDEQGEVVTEVEKEIVTISKLKEQLKDLADSRERIDVTDTAALAANEKAQVELQRKIAALEIKTLKERDKEAKKTELELLKTRIDEKRKAYEDYYAAIELLGKEAADEQFAALRKEGETYIAWLKKAQAGLDPKSPESGRQQVMITQEIQRAEGTLSPLDQLKLELEEMKRVYADFETYKKQFGIQAAKERFAGELGEFDSYLEFIKAKTVENQGAFTAILEGRATDGHRDTAKLLQEEAQEASRVEQQRFEEQLASLRNYHQQREDLIREHEALRAELLAKGYESEAEEAKRQFDRKIGELNNTAVQEAAGLTDFFNKVELMSRKAAEEGIDVLITEMQRLVNLPLEDGGITDEFFDETIKKLRTIQDNIDKEIPEALARWGGELKGIASELGNVDSAFSRMLTTAGDLIQATASVKANIDAFQKAQEANNGEGDVLGMVSAGTGILGVVGSVVGAITGHFKNLKKAQEEARKAMDDFYQSALQGEMEYQRLVREREMASVASGKTSYQAILAQLELLKSQAPEIEAAYNRVFAVLQGGEFAAEKGYRHGTWLRKAKTWDVMASLAGSDYERLEKLYLEGRLSEAATRDFEALRELREELEAAGLEVEDLQRQLAEMLTGTTADQLSDGFVALFRNGKLAAEDFGQSFEEIMRNAISNSFRYQYLEAQMQPFYEQLADMMADGTPSQLEIEALRNMYANIGQEAADYWKQMEQITGIQLSDQAAAQKPTGLSGAIRREMTEQTASELAGLTRAQYDLIKQTLALGELRFDLAKRQYDAVIGIMQSNAAIERNTGLTVSELRAVLSELRSINTNTKPSSNMRGYTA